MLANLSGLYALKADDNATAALPYFTSALAMSKGLDSKTDVTESLYNVGSAYSKQKDYKAATKYLQAAYDSCRQSFARQSIAENFACYWPKVIRQRADTASANQYLQKAIGFAKRNL